MLVSEWWDGEWECLLVYCWCCSLMLHGLTAVVYVVCKSTGRLRTFVCQSNICHVRPSDRSCRLSASAKRGKQEWLHEIFAFLDQVATSDVVLVLCFLEIIAAMRWQLLYVAASHHNLTTSRNLSMLRMRMPHTLTMSHIYHINPYFIYHEIVNIITF